MLLPFGIRSVFDHHPVVGGILISARQVLDIAY